MHTSITDQTPILIVDDDREILDLLSSFLRQHRYTIETVENGAHALEKIRNHIYGLVILDLMLPGEDGLSICRAIRAESQIPIIMLTALGHETDRIVGLEMGADDYLPKPFNPRELLARMKAVLRRFNIRGQDSNATQNQDLMVFEDWQLNLARRELRNYDGVLVPLTSGEYDLLLAFAEHAQRVLNRDQLLEITKGRSASAFDRSIDVQLSRLRKKIERDPKDPELIKTVRSGGYIFTPKVEYR